VPRPGTALLSRPAPGWCTSPRGCWMAPRWARCAPRIPTSSCSSVARTAARPPSCRPTRPCSRVRTGPSPSSWRATPRCAMRWRRWLSTDPRLRSRVRAVTPDARHPALLRRPVAVGCGQMDVPEAAGGRVGMRRDRRHWPAAEQAGGVPAVLFGADVELPPEDGAVEPQGRDRDRGRRDRSRSTCPAAGWCPHPCRVLRAATNVASPTDRSRRLSDGRWLPTPRRQPP
jgi:hypothetical protein